MAYIAEARCHLELGEIETACRRLQEGSEVLHPRIEQYVDVLFTKCPVASAYLHPWFKGEIDLHRLTKVIQWREPNLDESAIFESLNEYQIYLDRGSMEKFTKWRNPAINKTPVFKAIVNRELHLYNSYHCSELIASLPKAIWDSDIDGDIEYQWYGDHHVFLPPVKETPKEVFARLPQAIEKLEMMIETYSRFEAYQAEVQAIQQLGMSFHDWLKLAPSTEVQPDGAELMYIIPCKPLEV